MTQDTDPLCSAWKSAREDLNSQIEVAYSRLRAVMKEEAELRRSLEDLLDRKEKAALDELKRAQQSVEKTTVYREKIKRQLEADSEQLGGVLRLGTQGAISPNSPVVLPTRHRSPTPDESLPYNSQYLRIASGPTQCVPHGLDDSISRGNLRKLDERVTEIIEETNQLKDKQRRARIKIAEAAEKSRHLEGIKYKWEEKGTDDKQKIGEKERRKWAMEFESWKKHSKALEPRTFASDHASMRLEQDEEISLKLDEREVERILIGQCHFVGLPAMPASGGRIDPVQVSGNENGDIKGQKQLQARERTIWVEDAEDSEG